MFPIILVIIEAFTKENRKINKDVDFSEFSYTWTCFIIMGMLLILTAKKDLGIFVKINTIGVAFVIIVIIFVCCVGFYGFSNTEYFIFAVPPTNTADPSPQIVMFSSNFGPLMGILGGGYYLHNITLPIVRNAKNPKNNNRDLFIGYLMAFISYAGCGLLGYFGFSGSLFVVDNVPTPIA